MHLNESLIEEATLNWFEELGYAAVHGPMLAPGEFAAERDSFGDVVLGARLRDAVRCLNPAMPEEARATIQRFVQVRLEKKLNP